MADESMQPDDPALSIAARHALHDEELIAAFATDGDGVEDAARAKSLIERCVACRDLHADLAAIGTTLRAVGTAAAVSATVAAPRDFRITAETANRLRPGSVVVRFRDRLALAFATFGRPVGASLATFGLVGLLVGSVTFGGAGAMAPGAASIDAEATSSTHTPGELNGPAATALGSQRTSSTAKASTASPEVTEDGSGFASGSSGGGPAPSTFILGGSVLLVIAGLALVVLGSRRREPIAGR